MKRKSVVVAGTASVAYNVTFKSAFRGVAYSIGIGTIGYETTMLSVTFTLSLLGSLSFIGFSLFIVVIFLLDKQAPIFISVSIK